MNLTVKNLALVGIISLAGCATQLTEQGQKVRIIDRQSDYECEFINTVTGSNAMGNTKAHDSQGAMNEIRNNAANLGANAIRLLNLDVTSAATTALGEALKCKF